MGRMATAFDNIRSDPTVRPVLLTVEDVQAIMVARGLDEWHVELIDGELFDVSPQRAPHQLVKTRLQKLLTTALAGRPELNVTADGCFKINQLSAPEPDVMVWKHVRGEKWALANNVLLVVEVCASTQRTDYGRKLALYASSGIPEYWIADLDNGILVQFWEPADGVYLNQREAPFGGGIRSPTLGISIETSGIDDY
jgi:Uma2 family endonuclease